MSTRKRVRAYADGSAIGNPGPGGYGVVLIYRGVRRELSEGFRLTTNNRMELLAAIRALEALKEPCDVVLAMDSRYVLDGVARAPKWAQRGWRTSARRPVQNVDLWKRLIPLTQVHAVAVEWIEGHSGHKENEECDALANEAARERADSIDVDYERTARS